MLNLLLLLISAVFSLIIGKPIIEFLKKVGVKQHIREDGPKGHKETKFATPTIGSLVFIIPLITITVIVWILKKDLYSCNLLIILLVTLLGFITGLADDLLKILKKHNKGISGWSKLLIQFLAACLLFYLYYKEEHHLFWLVWVFFVFAGAANSYNLTDGLDGLLTSISIISLVSISLVLTLQGNHEVTAFLVIFIGSLIGFLYYNKYPAKVFMGDSGSLAIGSAIGGVAIATKTELYLLFFAIVPILEALSVIMQVISSQFSRRFLGKDIRVFKMTPLHHHFELLGWHERKVVKLFFLFQLVFSIIGAIFIVFFI